MGEAGPRTRVCDAGALIAIERRDERIRRIVSADDRYIVPAAVLAQVWREPSRQANLARFLAAAETVIEPLDEITAKAVGSALARSGTSDIVDASVVVNARRHEALVLTSDPADFLRIDPTLEMQRV